MPDYKLFVPFILRWEGGEVNDPVDRGGHTNMGITRSTFNTLSEMLIGNKPTTENFVNMTKQDALKFIEYYWMKATWNNRIKSQAVAEAMTSWFWGSGKYGIKQWQQMLRDRFGKKDILVDGIVGKQTVDYTNSIPEKKLLEVAIATREQTYRNIVSRYPEQSRFLRGWLNRLSDFSRRHSHIIKKTAGFGGAGLLIGIGLLFF
jgi:lysozyme family protein